VNGVVALADDLSGVPLFSSLNQRQLKKLARGFKERSFEPGRPVVREGHMEGSASVSVDGKVVSKLGPGEYFGELAMISEQARRATVTAETPLRCAVMVFYDFRKFAKDNPDVCWKLMQRLADILAAERSRQA
jgi:CRP-like cAMP-binding protein